MPLLDKFDAVRKLASGLEQAGRNPTSVVFDEMHSATVGVVNGRETILAGTNNYLGLTFDPACLGAGMEALQSKGTGTTGSRMANGSYALHIALERELLTGDAPPRAILAVSEMVRRDLIERFPVVADRIVVIPNGVDLERFSPASRGHTGRTSGSRETGSCCFSPATPA